jgi:hypothetical protein
MELIPVRLFGVISQQGSEIPCTLPLECPFPTWQAAKNINLFDKHNDSKRGYQDKLNSDVTIWNKPKLFVSFLTSTPYKKQQLPRNSS